MEDLYSVGFSSIPQPFLSREYFFLLPNGRSLIFYMVLEIVLTPQKSRGLGGETFLGRVSDRGATVEDNTKLRFR